MVREMVEYMIECVASEIFEAEYESQTLQSIWYFLVAPPDISNPRFPL